MCIIRKLLAAFCIASLVGCAATATSNHQYKENEPVAVENEVVIQKDFEAVWSDLVRQLATSFYVVNNIEKESRLINVSFSTSVPQDYIDCGVSRRSFERGATVENIEYNVAADSIYRFGNGRDATGVNAIVGTVNRDTSLDGRMNVYVAPSGNRTAVTVNVRYVLTIKASGRQDALNMYDRVVASQLIPTQVETISFSTNQPNETSDGISCFSKGVLENEILAMVGAAE